MPCRDYYDENPSAYYSDTIQGLKDQISFAESALCQTLAAFQRKINEQEFDAIKGVTPLDHIDFEEAGIKREELDAWWADHKRKDEASRIAEEEKKSKARLRKDALKKLSPAERVALGFK